MGNQIITQPQTFKTNTVVMGDTAGLSAVSGLTVYGDISASGTLYGALYGTSGNVMMQNVITATGGATYTLTNYTNNTASNYLVFLDGVKQRATTDYTISGSSIIFTSVVPSGVIIEVNVPQNISSLSGGFVSSVGLSSDGSLTVVTGSPITTSGDIALKVGTVPLASISNTGATAGQVLTYNGSTSTWVASAASGGVIAQSSVVTLTTQTSATITGIPSTAKKVTVLLNGMSTNGSSVPRIRVGAGSVVASGYKGSASNISATGVGSSLFSNGIAFSATTQSASNAYAGGIVFYHMGSNTWVFTGSVGLTDTGYTVLMNGSIALAGALDRICLTTATGTDAFDAGTMTIMWE